MAAPVIRYRLGEVPPFGCRWCGEGAYGHAQTWLPGRGFHGWVRPTDRQILARMLARRAARKQVGG